jgi:hypothetical protein
MRFFLFLSMVLGCARSFSSPHPVAVGAYINDIQNLELKSHSYAADIYLWFRWRNPDWDPATTMEFVNPFELWGHTKTLELGKPSKLSSGEFYQVVRNLGRFSTKLALYDYPFDRQTLSIAIEDASLGAEALQYVVAEEGVTMNTELVIPGFRIGKPSIRVVDHEYPTKFGDTDTAQKHSSSRLEIEIPILRPVFTYSVKLLIPVLCVIFTAALMFLFNPSFVDARVGIGITALLTIVALQITLNEDLPEVDYLVLMDKIYLASYFFVIASLATVVKTTWMMERGAAPGAVAWNRKALVILSVLYAFICALIIAVGWVRA